MTGSLTTKMFICENLFSSRIWQNCEIFIHVYPSKILGYTVIKGCVMDNNMCVAACSQDNGKYKYGHKGPASFIVDRCLAGYSTISQWSPHSNNK